MLPLSFLLPQRISVCWNITYILFTKIFLTCTLIISCNNPTDNSPCDGIDRGNTPKPPYYNPIWHPSGSFIGFNHTQLKRIDYSNECNPIQIFNNDSTGFWLIDNDGTNKRKIFSYTLLSPSWSPDGEWIVFVLGSQICKMKFTGSVFDTTSLVQLTKEGNNFLPEWSPDGQLIAYDSDNNSPNGMNFIWIMRADGSSKKRIVYQPSIGEIRNPSWSPDGKNLVHYRYTTGFLSSEIFIMDTSGMYSKRITVNSLYDRYPKYLFDGSKVAFWSNGNIWSADTSGQNLVQYTKTGIDADFGTPFSLKPNDSFIVYTYYHSNDWTYDNGTLWILNLVTGEKQQLTFNTAQTF